MGDDFIKIPPGPSHGGDIEAQVRALNDHVHKAIVAWREVNRLLATLRTTANDLATALPLTYQPLDSDLTAIAALSTTSYGRAFLTLANAAAARTATGTVIGTDVQAYDATLAALAALTIAANSLTIGTGTDAFSQTTFAANTFPARASTGNLVAKTITDLGLSLVASASSAAAQATLRLLPGTDVLAYDSFLSSIASLGSSADKMIYTTAADTAAETALTSFARSFLDDADAAAVRETIGAPNTTMSWWYTFGPRIIRGIGSATGTHLDTTAYAGTDGGQSDSTDADGNMSGANMTDSSLYDAFFTFPVPDDLDLTQAVTGTVYYRLAGAGTGAAVELEITARNIDDDEVNVSGGTLFTVASAKSVNSYASGDLVVHSLGTVFGANTLDAGSLVHGSLFRDSYAGNTDDTFAGTIMVAAIMFTGTRKTT